MRLPLPSSSTRGARPCWAALLSLTLSLPLAALAQAPTLTGISPTPNLRNAPRAANVAVTFDQVMQFSPSSASAVKVGSVCAAGRPSQSFRV